ncbi:rRNA pseudouridine synthase [Patescibacteria group bacterium]|nr:rRNA pseudouridine synthase [Patescibacteria group bacterium]MBU1916452.1 rRNA pseudouridine synthase [Patescibacteria group bacterium]
MKERINKYLSAQGICSRREADRLLTAGRVTVNGQPVSVGTKVSSDDQIEIDGELINNQPVKIYIILNKPVGVITTTDQRRPDNVINFIHLSERVFPVGRLDVLSSGLLLLTNDGELANRLTHPRYRHEKEYDVTVEQAVTDDQLELLKTGLKLADGPTLPAKVRRFDANRFRIVLREGRNRQIRRMCEALGLEIRRLKRVRVHTLKLGRLPIGHWRELTKKEVTELSSDRPSKQGRMR